MYFKDNVFLCFTSKFQGMLVVNVFVIKMLGSRISFVWNWKDAIIYFCSDLKYKSKMQSRWLNILCRYRHYKHRWLLHVKFWCRSSFMVSLQHPYKSLNWYHGKYWKLHQKNYYYPGSYNKNMDHGHEPFKYKFCIRNPKLFNQNAVLIVYDILIGCFQKVMTVRLVIYLNLGFLFVVGSAEGQNKNS